MNYLDEIKDEIVEEKIEGLDKIRSFEDIQTELLSNRIINTLKNKGLLLEGSRFDLIDNRCKMLLICLDDILPGKIIDTNGKVLSLSSKWMYKRIDANKVLVEYVFK